MDSKSPARRTGLERTFRVSLVLKGLDGVLELAGGVVLLFVSPTQISSLLRLLTQHELSEDPRDLIANSLMHLAGTMNGSTSLFGALYLLLHGAAKIVLVWAVLQDKLWAYPWMIGFLLVFIGYQAYRIVVRFSWGLVLLTAFLLTWHEYRSRRAQSATTSG